MAMAPPATPKSSTPPWPKAPHWRGFGNCRYGWSAWRIADGGVRTTTSLSGSPELAGKVAVHCETLRVSHQSSQGTWESGACPSPRTESNSAGAAARS